MQSRSFGLLTAAVTVAAGLLPAAAAEDPRARRHLEGDTVVVVLHATGTQDYECRKNAGGVLEWTFKAPAAEFFLNGARVGRHYAGPTWEYRDGSRIGGKVQAKAEGADSHDVPWLRLTVTGHARSGAFDPVDTVLRTDTRGGALQGGCDASGMLRNVPYQADYVFIRRS